MRTQFDDDGNVTNYEVGALPVESTVDGARDVPAVHESSTPQCEETLATPEAAPASHMGDDGQNDDPAGADAQPEPTVPQDTIDGPPPRNLAAVALLGDDGQDDDSEVNALEAAMDRTAQRHREEDEEDEPPFFPLRMRLAPPTPFPADALPPRMAAWAEALTLLTNGTYAVAAMMLTSFVGLALMAHGDVEMWGMPKPLQLLTFLAARSGTGKTASYLRLVKPVEDFVRAVSQGAGAVSGGLHPWLLVQDPTAQSILVDLPGARNGCMALFLDEGAVFLGSYSLGKEHALGMIGILSKLWDGSTITVSRKTSGRHVIDRKRFAVMVASPLAPFIGLLGSATVRQQGVLSRALFAAPARDPRRPELSPAERSAVEDALKSYDDFVLAALSREPLMAPGTTNCLQPPLLRFTEDAFAVITAFDREVQSTLETLPEEDPTHDLINKAAENAGRAAALFALVDDMDARVIDEAASRRGVALVRYSMSESIRVAVPAAPSKHADLADRIGRWMARKGLRVASMSQLQSASLGRKHTAAEFEPAIKLLLDSGWIVEDVAPRREGRRGGRAKRVYALTRAAMRELQFPGA
jgi:hypothetical protein